MNDTAIKTSNIGLLSPDNIKAKVLPHYGLTEDADITQVKFKDTDKQRSVYKVTKDDVSYCLKKVYFPANELLFIYSAIEWLYRNDIKVPRILSTKTHNRYVNYNNMLFILTPWIDGDKCDFDKIEHINMASKNLGKFHAALDGFMPILGSADKEGFANLYTSLNKHTEQMIECEKSALKYNDYFSKIYIISYTNSMTLATLAIQAASTINTDNLTKSVCHNDYVSKNLIIKNDDVYVIDFDKAKHDYCALDIGYCLRRLLRRENTNWNLDLAINFLEQYEIYNPLTVDDYKYLLAYLAFPQKYWKISRDYYKNISKCNKKSFINLLNNAVYDNHNHLDFTYNFINYIESKFNLNII